MMDLQKVKEALELALREHNSFMIQADLPTGSKKLEEALAELEKPVDEDAHSQIARIVSFVDRVKTPLMRSSATDLYELLEAELQQYAESYHAEKCEECKKSNIVRSCVNCDHWNKEKKYCGASDDDWRVINDQDCNKENGYSHWQPIPEEPK